MHIHHYIGHICFFFTRAHTEKSLHLTGISHAHNTLIHTAKNHNITHRCSSIEAHTHYFVPLTETHHLHTCLTGFTTHTVRSREEKQGNLGNTVEKKKRIEERKPREWDRSRERPENTVPAICRSPENSAKLWKAPTTGAPAILQLKTTKPDPPPVPLPAWPIGEDTKTVLLCGFRCG